MAETEVADQKGGTATPPAAAAAARTTQTITAPGKAGPAQERAEGGESGDGVPPGLKKEMFALRQERRELRAKLQELEAWKQEQANVRAEDNRRTNDAEKPSLFDDPDKYLEMKLSSFAGNIDKRIMDKVQELENKRNVMQSAREAQSWLLSQADFKDDPDAVDEIKDILADDELAAVARVSPKQAAKLAYMAWRESKGLDNGATAKASAARATGTKPSASRGSSGPKIWTKDEIVAYSNSLDYTAPDFREKWAEVEKALREGRIKE